MDTPAHPRHGDGEARLRVGWFAASVVAMLAAASLRFAFPGDIEYKADERWLFERSVNVGRTEPIPSLGLISSAQIQNPPLATWMFVALGRIARADDPPALARSVQTLNLMVIAIAMLFAWRAVPREEREAWLWAVWLGAVNPTAVILQRKIWPPSIEPLFSLGTIAGWWFRQRWWGAACFGLSGLLLGQVHLAGFFLLAGFTLWTLLFARRSIHWRGFLLGCGLGVLPMVHWLLYLPDALARPDAFGWSASRFDLGHIASLKFWQYWLYHSLGLGLRFPLGPDFSRFLADPAVLGHATWLVLALHGVVIIVGSIILWRGFRRMFIVGRESPTAFTVSAAFWGWGVLLTATGVTLHRHYMTIGFPLEMLWLAWLALGDERDVTSLRQRRALLATLWVAQLALSAGFLWFVHQHGGTRGDYGPAFRAGGSLF